MCLYNVWSLIHTTGERRSRFPQWSRVSIVIDVGEPEFDSLVAELESNAVIVRASHLSRKNFGRWLGRILLVDAKLASVLAKLLDQHVSHFVGCEALLLSNRCADHSWMKTHTMLDQQTIKADYHLLFQDVSGAHADTILVFLENKDIRNTLSGEIACNALSFPCQIRFRTKNNLGESQTAERAQSGDVVDESLDLLLGLLCLTRICTHNL